MAEQNTDVIQFIVTHGPDKHPLELGLTATVGELSQQLEDLTGVPTNGQKIINRGKTLQIHEQTLQEAGLKQGSKLMLIGKKSNPEEDENFKKIVEVESRIASSSSKQSSIADEVDDVEKGYLQKDQQEEYLSKLTKRLASCHEEYLRLLETLDGLELTECHPTVRKRRKATVQRIQKQLDQNDAISLKIERLQNKLAS